MSLHLRAVEKSLCINFTRCAGKRAQAYFDRLIVGQNFSRNVLASRLLKPCYTNQGRAS